MATVPHPARYATSLGPKSLAGFQPAWVRGENALISTATVNPMKNEANRLVVRLALRRSMREWHRRPR
jgi:hypothetical protein